MRYITKILLASGILAGFPAQAITELNYWLWDNNQLPSYQACAAAFEKQNPPAFSRRLGQPPYKP